MTADISDLIKKIKSKFIELNDKFNEGLNKNITLYAEIEATKCSLQEQRERNGNLELEIKNLKEQIKNLKEQIKTLNSQESKTISNQDKDLEIDMLVREIDHCIQTLKKN